MNEMMNEVVENAVETAVETPVEVVNTAANNGANGMSFIIGAAVGAAVTVAIGAVPKAVRWGKKKFQDRKARKAQKEVFVANEADNNQEGNDAPNEDVVVTE